MTPERREQLLALTSSNGAFSKLTPGLQLAWDSTSLGALKTCPRYYYLTIIEGWTSKHTNMHLAFGLYLHSALEFYDHCRAEGMDFEQALHATTRYCMEITGQYVQEHKCQECGIVYTIESSRENSRDDACMSCSSTSLEVATVWKPWTTDDSNKNRFTLVRAVVWYLLNFENDPVQTVILAGGKPAVELSFQFAIPLASGEGEGYKLCGHLDRLAEFGGQFWVLDRKTTKSTLSSNFFHQFSPDNQMSLYTIAGRTVLSKPIAGVVIDAVQCAVGFARFGRGFVLRTETQCEEWLADAYTWINLAEAYARAGHWPMNDKSCSMYGGCMFRETCSKDPSLRNRFLETSFARRKWDPTEAR